MKPEEIVDFTLRHHPGWATVDVVRYAMFVQRERCASVAEDMAAKLDEQNGENIGRNIALMIADGIRKSKD